MKKGIISIVLIFVMSLTFSQTWITSYKGIDSLWSGGGEYISCFYNDSDSVLYLSGAVKKVNNVWVNSIFKWNCNYFDNFSTGISDGGIGESVCFFNSKLFVCGAFWEVGNLPNTKYLGIWNGINWSGAPGGVPDGMMFDLVEFENKLIIGGQFGQVGGLIAHDIIAFDGTDFINIGNMAANWVRALKVCDGTLYAGGNFGIRRYLGGTQWEDLPGNPGYYVSEMAADTFNSFLYVGGSFSYVGDLTSTCVAMWDGFKWNSLGAVINCDIYDQAMAVYHGDLYVGGCIDTLFNGIDANGIARWDGTEWHSLNSGTMYNPINNPGSPGLVRALEVFQDTLRVGGTFREAGGLQAYGLASWHMPEIPCNYMKPMVYSDTTTYYLIDDTAEVQFYNNNPYVESWQWDFGDSGTDNVRNPLHVYTDTGTFDVQVTVEHEGCIKTGTKTIVVDYPLNLPETKKENNGFKLHPNPASNMLFIEISGYIINKNSDLVVSDIKGNVILKQKADSEKISIDISGFAKGSYIVTYGGCSEKFVKE